MNFNLFELVNVLVIGWGVSVLWRQRKISTLMLVLFACGTLHFSYAAIALLSSNKSRLLVDMHIEGSGLLANLSTLLVLVAVFSAMGWRACKAFATGTDNRSARVLLFIVIVMSAQLCGYLMNYRAADLGQLMNVASVLAMLLLIALAYYASSTNATLSYKCNGFYLLGLGFIVTIAFFEVYFSISWSWFQNSSGAIVYRASSVLFNPNLFGFWASLIYLAFAYGMHMAVHRDQYHRFLLGLVLASCAIYLSGSRSSAVGLLGVLFLVALLIKDSKRWVPVIIFPTVILSIYVSALVLQGDSGWRAISLLGERFIEAPSHLAGYVLKTFGTVSDIPPEVELSIEGRFTGELKDAGWLVLYQDTGLLGQFAFFSAAIFVLARATYVWKLHPCPASAYSLALLLYCMITGLVMRFQIFPVWLFFGLALAICLVCWDRIMTISKEA